jgi:hypothetical protein
MYNYWDVFVDGIINAGTAFSAQLRLCWLLINSRQLAIWRFSMIDGGLLMARACTSNFTTLSPSWIVNGYLLLIIPVVD